MDSFTVTAYVYSPGDEDLEPIDIMSSSNVMVAVVNTSQNTTHVDRFTAVSMLTTTLSVLGDGESVSCGSNEVRSENLSVNYTIYG